MTEWKFYNGTKLNLFHFLRSIEVRTLIFGHVVVSTSTVLYIKLYGYLWVLLQIMVHLISY